MRSRSGVKGIKLGGFSETGTFRREADLRKQMINQVVYVLNSNLWAIQVETVSPMATEFTRMVVIQMISVLNALTV